MACGLTVASTGAFKFQSHIISCSLLPNEVKKHFKDLRGSTENQRRAKREHQAVQEEEAQVAALEHEAKRA